MKLPIAATVVTSTLITSAHLVMSFHQSTTVLQLMFVVLTKFNARMALVSMNFLNALNKPALLAPLNVGMEHARLPSADAHQELPALVSFQSSALMDHASSLLLIVPNTLNAQSTSHTDAVQVIAEQEVKIAQPWLSAHHKCQ